MNYSESRWDWSEIGMDFLFQLGLLVAVFALGVWLWPDAMLGKPVAVISFGEWLWAAGSVVVGILGLLMSYFVLAEPVIALIKGSRAK